MDIVERLRPASGMYVPTYGELEHEAADEIERLRIELKEMQTKLDKIAKHPNTPELIRQYAAGMLDDRTAGPLNSAPS